MAGVVFLIKQHLGQDLPKDHAIVQAAQAWLTAEFDAGRQTAVEWEELARWF